MGWPFLSFLSLRFFGSPRSHSSRLAVIPCRDRGVVGQINPFPGLCGIEGRRRLLDLANSGSMNRCKSARHRICRRSCWFVSCWFGRRRPVKGSRLVHNSSRLVNGRPVQLVRNAGGQGK